jgi:hypothetical protein
VQLALTHQLQNSDTTHEPENEKRISSTFSNRRQALTHQLQISNTKEKNASCKFKLHT